MTKRELSVIAGLFLLTLGIYAQAMECDFIRFDDDLYVRHNPFVWDGITWRGLKWAFLADLLSDSPNADYWQPVTMISRMIDFELYGGDPAGHHMTNVGLHALNAILLFFLLKKLTGEFWPSALVGTIFAAHPLQVEAVVWITSRKDVLSMFFGLLTIQAYAHYAERPAADRYGPLVLWFVLGLMSKPMLVSLPLVLLLLDVWPLNRLDLGWKKLILEKVPLLILSAASSLITSINLPTQYGSVGEYLINFCISYVWYLWKFIYPVDLAVFYPVPMSTPHPLWAAIMCGGLILGISVLAVRQIRRRPYFFVGWFWFLVSFLPRICVTHGQLADRFTYLPHIGLMIGISWGLAGIAAVLPGFRQALPVAATVVVVTLGGAAWKQATLWIDTETLFTRTVVLTHGNWMAHTVLGNTFMEEERYEEAADHYFKAVHIKPDHLFALTGIVNALTRMGRTEEAKRYAAEVDRISPSYNAMGFNNKGVLLAQRGNLEEAYFYLSKSVNINPRHAEAQYNLARVCLALGREEDAITFFTEALRVDPKFSKAQTALDRLRENQITEQQSIP